MRKVFTLFVSVVSGRSWLYRAEVGVKNVRKVFTLFVRKVSVVSGAVKMGGQAIRVSPLLNKRNIQFLKKKIK